MRSPGISILSEVSGTSITLSSSVLNGKLRDMVLPIFGEQDRNYKPAPRLPHSHDVSVSTDLQIVGLMQKAFGSHAKAHGHALGASARSRFASSPMRVTIANVFREVTGHRWLSRRGAGVRRATVRPSERRTLQPPLHKIASMPLRRITFNSTRAEPVG